MIAFELTSICKKSWVTLGSGPSWMDLCWKWTGLVSQTFAGPFIYYERQDKKWQPCVDWSFSLALGRTHDPHFPLTLHGNLTRIESDWKLSGAQKPVQSVEGNVGMKTSNLCSKQLPQVETIRATVAAHQANGYSAFSASNYVGDHTLRKNFRHSASSKIPAPVLLNFLFTTNCIVALHHLLCCCMLQDGSKFLLFDPVCVSALGMNWCYYLTSYLYEVKWYAGDFWQLHNILVWAFWKKTHFFSVIW